MVIHGNGTTKNKRIILPIFYPGKKIESNGAIYTVDHVKVRCYNLIIKFKELTEEVDSERIHCEPNVFEFTPKLNKGAKNA